MLLNMTLISMTAVAMTRERERGTLENLLAMPARPFEVMIGKIAPFHHHRLLANIRHSFGRAHFV